MGWHLDGKVTAVIGTHTHVQTADERILPNGTAYMTDAGMTGPHDSIIGMEKGPSLGRFLNGMPSKFEPATANPRLNGAVIEADEKTGKATRIIRISYSRPPRPAPNEPRCEFAVRSAVRRAATV
jgi:calcineurin-like phosphoesterase